MSKLVVLMVKAVNMVVRVMLTLRKVTMIMVIMIGDGQGERVGGTERGRPCTSSAVPPALQIMNNANTNFTSSSSFFSSSSSLSLSTSSSPSSWLYSISFWQYSQLQGGWNMHRSEFLPFQLLHREKSSWNLWKILVFLFLIFRYQRDLINTEELGSHER